MRRISLGKSNLRLEDFLSNRIADNLDNGNSKPLVAHTERSRGQSSHINKDNQSDNALFQNSQTHSVNDSKYDFD